jgi:hypothetical protein
MTTEQAYVQFLTLVNRNATNNKVNVDKPRFVILFNDIQRRYVEWILEKRNEDSIRFISRLLIQEFPLNVSAEKETHNLYSLPANYFDLANVHVYASTDCCGKRKMQTHEVKSEDVEELLADENNKPSFKAAETFYLTTSDTVAVYKDDFTIEEVLLSYYRYPVSIDIAGYINLDSSASTTVNPEFDDKVVNRILIGMAKEFSAINSDTASYQLDKDRLFTEV